MGHRHDDHRRLRRHGPQDVRGDVCGSPLRLGRGADHSPSSAGHSLQFFDVLLPHTGKILYYINFLSTGRRSGLLGGRRGLADTKNDHFNYKFKSQIFIFKKQTNNGAINKGRGFSLTRFLVLLPLLLQFLLFLLHVRLFFVLVHWGQTTPRRGQIESSVFLR